MGECCFCFYRKLYPGLRGEDVLNSVLPSRVVSSMQPANENSPPPPHERRRAFRRRVLLNGRMISTRSNVTSSCTIRNMSPTGALLGLNPEAVAAEPVLIVLREGVAYESRIVWQTVSNAGVRFISAVDLREPLPPRLQRAREIWLAAS